MAPRDDGRVTGLRTIFFGSGSFAIPSLEALVRRPEIEIIAVITPPDGPVGRRGVLTPVPVATAAEQLGLPVERIKRVRADPAVRAIRDLAPDLGVLADFGQLVPQAVIDVPAHGILNVHPSILPRHRGATPIPATILAGDDEAGVTIMQMDAGLDTGPIVA
ncbi:MAG: methionyl-tRNA formyltransferase, partial [Chloroflexota bacterium]